MVNRFQKGGIPQLLVYSICGWTYRALKKKSNQVAVGRKGRKNCRVIGMRSDIISRVAANVFVSGPGD